MLCFQTHPLSINICIEQKPCCVGGRGQRLWRRTRGYGREWSCEEESRWIGQQLHFTLDKQVTCIAYHAVLLLWTMKTQPFLLPAAIMCGMAILFMKSMYPLYLWCPLCFVQPPSTVVPGGCQKKREIESTTDPPCCMSRRQWTVLSLSVVGLCFPSGQRELLILETSSIIISNSFILFFRVK